MRFRSARATTIRPRFLTRTGALSSALALMLLFSVVGATSVPAAGSAGPDPASGRQQAPRTDAHTLDARLAALAERVAQADDSGARAIADATGLDYERGRVTAVIEVESGKKGPVRAALKAFGAEETGEYRDLIRARVPVGILRALANRADVEKVRPPMRPQKATAEAPTTPRSSADSAASRAASVAAAVRAVTSAPTASPASASTFERTPATVASPPGRESSVSAAAAASVQPAEDAVFAHGFETWSGPWAAWSPAGPTWGQTAYRASEGFSSAYCAGSSINPPGPYADNMQAWLWTAQPIDLTGLSAPMLSFDIWLDSELDWDTLFVGFSTNDAEGTGDYDGYTFSGNSQGWVTIDIDMTDIETLNFAGEPEVWVAFIFESDGSITAEGAYIDDVRIAEAPATVTSQGVAETNAAALHAEGTDGTGTKVGIIDLGFHGYQALLGSELPGTVTTWGGGQAPEGSGADTHGTAVAEIVHDMAPGAELYLARIVDEVDFGNAAAWMVSEGVDVVNASFGWFEGPRDGTGIINEIADDTVEAGVFWAQAAGNSRLDHWRGDFVAHSLVPNVLVWSGNDPYQTFMGIEGEVAEASLMWDDDWSAATQDYDLDLMRRVNGSWEIVVSSEYGQSGISGQEPVEQIVTVLPADGEYAWRVVRYSATRTDVDFDFFDWGRELKYPVSGRSFLIPADNASTGFMATAAVGRAPAYSQEYYSAEGPTRDGRLTPEIAMPSSVRNRTEGTFAGTSAAAPHLAGAAALVKQEYPGYTPHQLENHLKALTVDLGVPGPDNVFGHGRLWLGGDVPPPNVDLVEIAGGGRYETAAKASEFGWPDGSEAVVLSTGRNWPDALGGATLAGVLDAPILLTARDSVPAVTLAEMDRLQPDYVFILGGTSAVSTKVENQLKAKYGLDPWGDERVWRLDGANRYETSWFIAMVTTDPIVQPGWDGTVFIATGRNYPDALAASSVAAAHGYPIVLVNPRDLGFTATFLEEYLGAERVVILGGTSAVPTEILRGLRDTFGSANVMRIGGDTRYDTAKRIAEWGVTEKGLSYNRVAIATGQNYPDALTGGALQGRHRSVMLLTRSSVLSPEPAALLTREKALIDEVRFLGGLSSVSQGVRDSVADIFR